MAAVETKSVGVQAQQIPGVETFKKVFDEQTGRWTQMVDEMGKAHSKWIEYGNSQIDEVAELAKTQFNYFNDLASGWRKMTLDTMKKAFDPYAK